jgi:hypothetical protein
LAVYDDVSGLAIWTVTGNSISGIALSGLDSLLAFMHCHISSSDGSLYLIGVSIASSPSVIYIWKLCFTLSGLDSYCLISKTSLSSAEAILHIEPICREYRLDRGDEAFLTVDDNSIVRYWEMAENGGGLKGGIQFSIERNEDWIVSRVKADLNGNMAVGI